MIHASSLFVFVGVSFDHMPSSDLVRVMSDDTPDVRVSVDMVSSKGFTVLPFLGFPWLTLSKRREDEARSWGTA